MSLNNCHYKQQITHLTTLFHIFARVSFLSFSVSLLHLFSLTHLISLGVIFYVCNSLYHFISSPATRCTVSASPFCRSLANFYEEHREPYEYLGQTTYYPSVTTVLSVIHKPQIVQWARDIERRSLKARLLTAVSNNAMPADEAQVIQILEDAQKKADLVYFFDVHSLISTRRPERERL